jgi:Cu/Ag efflux protein CusF
MKTKNKTPKTKLKYACSSISTTVYNAKTKKTKHKNRDKKKKEKISSAVQQHHAAAEKITLKHPRICALAIVNTVL